MVERSRDWMEQAERDLEHAKRDLRDGFYEWACFSAQQAAEKAAKAVLSRLGAEAFGHSVASLLEELPGPNRPGRDVYEMALELDKAYVPTRYPNVHPFGAPYKLYTATEAMRLIGHAEKILAFCKGLLSKIQP